MFGIFRSVAGLPPLAGHAVQYQRLFNMQPTVGLAHRLLLVDGMDAASSSETSVASRRGRAACGNPALPVAGTLLLARLS